MSSFKFPPPPPPPPKATYIQDQISNTFSVRGSYGSRGYRGNGDNRGRGRGRGYTSRGRGSHPPDRREFSTTNTAYSYNGSGVKDAGASRSFGHRSTQPYPGRGSYHAQPFDPARAAQRWIPHYTQAQSVAQTLSSNGGAYNANHTSRTSFGANGVKQTTSPPAGIKRKREQIPNSSNVQRDCTRRGKVEVAPAVPSFGFSLPTTSNGPQDVGTIGSTKVKKQREFNRLGLTPRKEEHEDSEEDIDEEAAFQGATGVIQIEYKGQLSTLGSASDIAAWIAERKKRYPTKARIEAKKKEAEARRLALLRAKVEKSQLATRSEQKKRVQQTKSNDSKDDKRRKALEKHLAKAEKLRRELEQSQSSGRKSKSKRPSSVRAPDSKPQPSKSTTNSLGIDYDSTDDAISNDQDPAGSSSDDADSTDNSSESDQASSKASSNHAPPEEEPIQRRSANVWPIRPSPDKPVRQHLCKFYRDGRRCPNGKRCNYRHEKPAAVQKKPGRIRLYDRLLEQQQREDDMLALQAIKYLGSTGFFEKHDMAGT